MGTYVHNVPRHVMPGERISIHQDFDNDDGLLIQLNFKNI